MAVSVGLLVLAGLLFVVLGGGGDPTTRAEVPEGTLEVRIQKTEGEPANTFLTARLEDGTRVEVLMPEDGAALEQIAGVPVGASESVVQGEFILTLEGFPGAYIDIEQQDGGWVFVDVAEGPAS